MGSAVLILEIAEPVGSNLHHILQFAVNLVDLLLDACHKLVSLILIELQDALHLYLEQTEDVVFGNLTNHLRVERSESLVDIFANGINVRSILELLILIDTFLDEYLLERCEVELFEEFALTNLEFLTKEVLGVFHIMFKDIADSEELRFVVLDDAAVWRDVYLAVREGEERVESLVGRSSWCQLHLYLDVCRRVVVNVTCLDLSFVDSLEDGLDECCGGLAERYLADDESLGIDLLYLCAHLEYSATLSVVVARNIYAAACGEVGIEHERTSVEVIYGSVANLAEVMRKNLCR